MELLIKLCHPDAILPTKAHPDDTGYDLTIISLIKTMDENTKMFDTGVAVKPPEGYYTEVVPRSSFSKSGYLLANSVGIIDSSYRGTIKIVLRGAGELQMPYKGFQLILRKREDAVVKQVDFLEETERGEGGFGSTDTKS